MSNEIPIGVALIVIGILMLALVVRHANKKGLNIPMYISSMEKEFAIGWYDVICIAGLMLVVVGIIVLCFSCE